MARTYGKAQDLIDFTRASGGTALRRVKYGAELVTNGTFDSDVSGWYGVSAGVVSHDSTNNALKVTASAGDNFAAGETTISTVVGAVYKLAVDIISFSGINVQIGIATTSNGVDISLSNQTDLQYSVTFVAQSATTYIKFGTNDTSGLSHNAVFDNISVKEVTFDTSDGDLILFNHPVNVPRIEYDADGNLLGLLVEESRTNLIPYSNFNSGWLEKDAVVTLDQAVSPDGEISAALLQYDTDSTWHAHRVILSLGAVSSVTASCYYKAKEITEVRHNVFNGTADCAVVVDLTNGEITSTINDSAIQASSVKDCGNGWYRVSITTESTGVSTYQLQAGRSVGTTYNGTDGLYIYGAQLEAGSFPTSYIPTSGSTATRSADVASIATSGFGYRQDEGTLYAEASVFDSDSGTSVALFLGNDTSNYVNIYTQYSAYYRSASVGGSVSSGNIVLDTGDPISNSSKVATSWKYGSSFNASRDGSLGTGYSDFVALTDNPDAVYVGSRNAATSSFLNGHIKSLKYYPRRLLNSQLQELTS